MKRSQYNFSIPNKYVLIVLTVVCFGLLGVSSLKSEALQPVKNAVAYIMVPIQKGLNHTGAYLNDKTSKFKEMKSALSENELLKQRVETLTEENNRLSLEKYELERLRELYQLDQAYLEYNKVGARVIAKDSGNWFHIFRIDKGADDGIQVDNNVISGGGLVGIVIDVGPNYATVRSIIDDSSNVSAMAASNSAVCFVSGDLTLFEEGYLRLGYIDKNDEIPDDERIITSDTSEKFLPGLLIGYARGVEVDSNNVTKSGYLVPVVNFSKLHEVLVITDLKETGEPRK